MFTFGILAAQLGETLIYSLQNEPTLLITASHWLALEVTLFPVHSRLLLSSADNVLILS